MEAVEFLKPEIADRLIVYGIDPEARALLRSIRPLVQQEAPSAARLNFERLLEHRLDVAALVRPHFDALIHAESRHFENLFRADFGDDYASSLYRTFEVEAAAGIGTRARNAVGQRLLKPLFHEVRRRHRFSGRAATRACGIIASALGFDLNNAIALEQRESRRAVDARHTVLDSVACDIRGAVASMAGRVSNAAAEIGMRAVSTLGQAEAAGQQACATRSRAEESHARASMAASTTSDIDRTIKQVAEGTQRVVERAVHSVTQAATTSSFVEELVSMTKRIGSVVSLIAQIAHQTNLLALNATIEASRAGEMGRGFSVVAAEVKSLAKQTTEATGEVADQIKQLQQAADRVSTSVAAIGAMIHELEGCAQGMSGTIAQQHMLLATMTEDAAAVMSAVSSLAEATQGVAIAVGQTKGNAGEVQALADVLAREAGQIEASLARHFEALRAA